MRAVQLNQFGLLAQVSATCSSEFQLCNVSMKCMSVPVSFVLKLRGGGCLFCVPALLDR